jgi:hypothetical protein
MTSFFHDLEEQLRAAAHERTGSAPQSTGAAPAPDRSPRRRRLTRGLRALPVLAAVAVTLAIVVGALLLLVPKHSHTPPLPPAGGGLGAILGSQPAAQTQRELRYIGQATQSVQQSAACRQDGPFRVRLLHTRPSPALLGALGVLRRRPTPADHLAMHLLNAAAPVYAGSVRRAFQAAGISYYIYVQHDNGSEYPSDHCLALQLDAVKRALPTIPTPLRAPTRTLEARLVAYERKLKALPRQDTLCFAVQAHNGGSSECGASLAQIEKGFTAGGFGDTVSGIVPDGVASVTLRVSARSGYPARSYTATVHDNIYAVRVPGAFSGAGGNFTTIWHAADGHTVKVIRPTSAAATARACRRRPVECLANYPASAGSSESSSTTSAAAPAPHPKSGG